MSTVQSSAAQQNLVAAADALASVADFDGNAIGGVLLVSEVDADEYELAQLQPTSTAAPVLLSVGQSAIRSYRQCEVIDYDPVAVCVGDQVMWMALGDVPLLDSIVNDSSDFANIELFDPKKAKLAKSRLTAIRVEAEAGPVVFIQAMHGSQVVARSTKYGVLVRRGIIDVPKGDLLLLNRGVTAFTASGFIFFRSRSAFQNLFRLLEELRARAEETFLEVTEYLSIDGFDLMLGAVTSQTQMLGKMASIRAKIEKYPKYKEALTMPKLLAFVRSHPECKVDLSGDGEDAKLVFRSDPQHRFKIMKLLDDDFLRSELTSLEYESNSKGQPIAG